MPFSPDLWQNNLRDELQCSLWLEKVRQVLQAQQYLAACLCQQKCSAEQEDSGSKGRSKAICSTASAKDAPPNLSCSPSGLKQDQQ